MNIGKILSFISPAAGMATGQGIGNAMPFLSPMAGAAMGKGPFQNAWWDGRPHGR